MKKNNNKKEKINNDEKMFLNQLNEMPFESRMEYINKFKSDLEKQVSDNDKKIDISKKMLEYQIPMIIFGQLLGFVFGAAANIDNFIIGGMYYSLLTLTVSIPLVSAVTISCFIAKKLYKRKNIQLDTLISKVNSIKKEYDNALLNEKNKESELVESVIKTSLNQKSNIIENEVIEEVNEKDENIQYNGKLKIRKK